MKLTIFIIILFILLIRVIFLTCGHLTIVFYKEATNMAVKKISENIEEYVKSEHMIKFMNNMIWIFLFIILLIAAFKGNITIQ